MKKNFNSEKLNIAQELKSFIQRGKRTAIHNLPLKEISHKNKEVFFGEPELQVSTSVKTQEMIKTSKKWSEQDNKNPLALENENMTLSSLEESKQKMQTCLKCSLSQSRNQVIFGDGDINSLLYIIGEAPGRDEDLQGLPFVGRSGQLLTKMLEAIAIQRKDIFISNIIKCRPPDNRDPQLEEIALCSPYMKWQIQFGKPKYILTLGRFSTGYFLNDYKSSLGNLRGMVHPSLDYEGVGIIPTYHPAAILRSPHKWKPLVWEDLKKLAHLLLEENFYHPDQIHLLKENKVI